MASNIIDANIDPSLGRLGKLPPELRDCIYDLTIDSSDEEVDAVGVCRPHTDLCFVSKEIYQECIGVFRKFVKRGCRHRNLRVNADRTRQGSKGDNGARRQPLQDGPHRHYLNQNGSTIRFPAGVDAVASLLDLGLASFEPPGMQDGGKKLWGGAVRAAV